MYTRTRCRATLRRPAWPGKLIYPSDHAVGLLVGEVTAGLVVELFHAGKLIYPSYTFGGRAGGFSAVGLLVSLLPVGLLVGEVVAGLAVVLLHAGKLINFSKLTHNIRYDATFFEPSYLSLFRLSRDCHGGF